MPHEGSRYSVPRAASRHAELDRYRSVAQIRPRFEDRIRTVGQARPLGYRSVRVSSSFRHGG
jgi:hypothetical protein